MPRLSNLLWPIFAGSILLAIAVGYIGLRTTIDIEWILIAVFAVAILGAPAMIAAVFIAQARQLRVLTRAARIYRRRYRLRVIEEQARMIIPILIALFAIAAMIYAIVRLIDRMT